MTDAKEPPDHKDESDDQTEEKPQPRLSLAALISGLPTDQGIRAKPGDELYDSLLAYNLLQLLIACAAGQRRIADYMGTPGPMRRRWFLFGRWIVKRPWTVEDLDPRELAVLRELDALKNALTNAAGMHMAHGQRLGILKHTLHWTRLYIGLDKPTPEEMAEMNRKQRRNAQRIVGPNGQSSAMQLIRNNERIKGGN